jgi:hypothetical protein
MGGMRWRQLLMLPDLHWGWDVSEWSSQRDLVQIWPRTRIEERRERSSPCSCVESQRGKTEGSCPQDARCGRWSRHTGASTCVSRHAGRVGWECIFKIESAQEAVILFVDLVEKCRTELQDERRSWAFHRRGAANPMRRHARDDGDEEPTNSGLARRGCWTGGRCTWRWAGKRCATGVRGITLC